MSDPKGATPLEWYTFDMELGLHGNLLPCVPAGDDVQVVPGSALEGKVGKIPSMFNQQGLAHGITDWQKRDILDNELALWRQDPRLNICVRTGPKSGVYAFDVDVDDAAKAEHVCSVIEEEFGQSFSKRMRSNSGKFLIPFIMTEGSCRKQVIKLEAGKKGARIELLADGQQFVAAGTHSSGVRYEWSGGLPSRLPSLTLSQVQDIWTTLTNVFGVAETTTSTSTISSTETTPANPTSSVLTEITEGEWNDLRQALRFMLDKVEDNDTWSAIGYGLLSLRRSRPAEQLWYEFSQKAVGYTEGAPQDWWSAHSTQEPHSDYRHIFGLARERGWQRQSTPDSFPVISYDGEEDGGGQGAAPPPIPFIQVTDPGLVENVEQISRVMYPLIYTQGNMLTRLGRENLDDAIRRGEDQVVLIPVGAGWARVEASRIAQFQKWSEKKGDWTNISAPSELIVCWLGQGDWPVLRPLEAIARAPFVRPDGSICDVSGYDPRSRALYIPSVAFPEVPTEPDHDSALIALERLLSPFDQFPWYDDAARSAFAAHILTEAARLAVDRVPMFWYTAPDAGTGKTILSEMASTIVHGSEPAVRPWVAEGDELRKTLFASLLAGDRSISFDNVPTGFKARAPELCAFLTSAVWKDRKLGASEVHSVPNRAVVSASGNNVTPVSDLARRCLVVRLDANSERMKERRFKITNLRAYILEHRPELLVDALTIIKAYNATERVDLTPLPSFEKWSQFVREPLVWLGMADPCATQAETDDETSSIGEIFQKIGNMFSGRDFTCVDIAQAAGGLMDQTGELRAMMVAHGCKEPSDSKIVGYWLRALRDKNAGGYKLVQAGQSRFGAKWLLNKTCEDLA